MEKTAEDTPKKSSQNSEPRNFLAAFLLVLGLGGTGANRLYTGDTTVGWIRFALFVGGIVLSPIIIGLPLFWAAQIWGLIDVFVVYHGKHRDGEGNDMVATERDKKAAKILYIIFIIFLILAVLGAVIMAIIGASLGSWMDGTMNGGEMNSGQEVPAEFENIDLEQY